MRRDPRSLSPALQALVKGNKLLHIFAMVLRLYEVISSPEKSKAVLSLKEYEGILHCDTGQTLSNGTVKVRFLLGETGQQGFLDRLYETIMGDPMGRILVLPVELTLPKEDTGRSEDRKSPAPVVQARSGPTREEIYDDVESGARLNRYFIVLTVLSSLVAAIGLLNDNTAAVIGAMVIAPLLGPNLALTLGAALGDTGLMRGALVTNAAGVGLTILVSFLLGLLVPVDLASAELMARTYVGFGDVALALLAGAAAVLSLTRGVPSNLVGVMVAVAMMPPAVATGLFFSSGELVLSGRAFLLLCVNVICVNIAAQIVFSVLNIRPRSWLEKRASKQSVRLNFTVWGVLFVCAVLIVWFLASKTVT